MLVHQRVFHKSLIQRRFSQPGYIRIIFFMVMKCSLPDRPSPHVEVLFSFCIVLKGNTWNNKNMRKQNHQSLRPSALHQILSPIWSIWAEHCCKSQQSWDGHPFSFTLKAADWKFQAFPTQNIPLRHLGLKKNESGSMIKFKLAKHRGCGGWSNPGGI